MTIRTIEVNVTDLEKSVVKLLADGCTVPEIAKALALNSRTLETRVSNIRERYTARNIAHLVAIFLRNKLID